ncbi:hypothetical protein [Chelatococcus reniformis]|uniref:Uncharacterized protein n=1 Tax=Chelatococcus reniformis TaxID=1494448 RepID=A0A916XGX3_9HYPH|nr:hypothetical protein [Chelatococcus reniformis]GGC71180.1 hypothetical protein GCM10010994_32090 [Chelatococcus reniformis]
MRSQLIALAMIAVGAAGPAAAAPQAVSAKAEAGRLTRIAMHADVGPGCTLGPAPEIRITRKPRYGTLTVLKARVVSKTGACAGKEIPVQDILYKARSGGRTDTVGYDVIDGKRDRSVEMRISVAPAGAAAR